MRWIVRQAGRNPALATIGVLVVVLATDPGEPLRDEPVHPWPASGYCGLQDPGLASRPPAGPKTLSPEITWAFDADFPADARPYINELLQDIRGPLESVIGLPSQSLTVLVVFDETLIQRHGVIGSYDPYGDTLTLGDLPHATDDAVFNEIFTHETVHAYQDAALFGFDSWIVEGIAVTATSLVQAALAGERELRDRWSLGVLSSNYDSINQAGYQAVAGGHNFQQSPNGLFFYMAAGGLCWILAASQEDSAPGDWLSVDYLATISQEIYDGRRFSTPDVLDAIRRTAVRPIDGMEASDWVGEQPVTNTAGAVGSHVWVVPVNNNLYQQHPPFPPYCQIWYRPFRRTIIGGTPITLRNVTTVFRIRNDAGELIWEAEHTVPDDLPWGMVGLDPPDELHEIPGAYHIEVDGRSYGAGRVHLTVQSPPPPHNEGYDADAGVPVTLFDRRDRSIAHSLTGFTGADLVGEFAGTYVFSPEAMDHYPSDVELSLDGPLGPLVAITTVPLPYRRVVQVDLPWLDDAIASEPDLVIEQILEEEGEIANGDGQLQTGELCDVTVTLRNRSERRVESGTLEGRWVDPDGSLTWIVDRAEVASIPAGDLAWAPPLTFRVDGSDILLSREYDVVWASRLFSSTLGRFTVLANPIEHTVLEESVAWCRHASRDSRFLYFVTSGGWTEHLWVKELETGDRFRIETDPGGFQSYAVHDGAVAYLWMNWGWTWRATLNLFDPASGEDLVILEDTEGGLDTGTAVALSDRYLVWRGFGRTVRWIHGHPVRSEPDDPPIVIMDGVLPLWAYDRDTGSARRVTNEVGEADETLPVLAGSFVAFRHGQRVRLIDLDGDLDTYLTRPGEEVVDIAAGYGQIAWLTADLHLAVYDLATGDTRWILLPDGIIPWSRIELGRDWAALSADYLGRQSLVLVSIEDGRVLPWAMNFNGPTVWRDCVIYTVAGKVGGAEIREIDLAKQPGSPYFSAVP